MRKKQIVNMYNEAMTALSTIKINIIKYIEDSGGKWVDHGTDDNDRTCFEINGLLVGVSTYRWDVDCKEVGFTEFLKAITGTNDVEGHIAIIGIDERLNLLDMSGLEDIIANSEFEFKHLQPMDEVVHITKRSKTAAHKRLMRKGRRQYYRKGRKP